MTNKIHFSDRGHILAAVGAAVGIANLVLFPARVYNYGGFAFILIFVLCTFLMGVPLMIGETALGKNGQSDAVRAYQGIGGQSWSYAGKFGLVTTCFILSFYIVVAGWALYYFYLYLFNYQVISSTNTGQLFGTFITDEKLVILFSGLFMAATILVVANNIQRGIEWVSKKFVPLLILLMVFLIIAVPLVKGVELNYGNFDFDFSKLFTMDQSGRFGITEAVGQAFFSLSLGACGMITYGSHVAKNTNVVSNSHYIVHTDTVVAILAGVLIIPLFSATGQVSAGPPLVFINLVDTFNSFGTLWGRVIGIAFFLLFNMAVLTSTISLLEPSVSYLSKNEKNGRRFYAILIGGLIFLMSVPAALSIDPANHIFFTNFLGYGVVGDGTHSMGYFNFILDFFGTFCILAGGFLLTLFIRQKWFMEGLFNEIKVKQYTPTDNLKQFLKVSILWLTPILLVCLFGAECFKVLFKLGIVQ